MSVDFIWHKNFSSVLYLQKRMSSGGGWSILSNAACDSWYSDDHGYVFQFLVISCLAKEAMVVNFNATITKFNSTHIALHCTWSLSNTRSLMECAMVIMWEQVYHYAFVYRDGCHVCRSPLGKTYDVIQDEYMYQGPHHVKGTAERLFQELFCITCYHYNLGRATSW